MILSGYAAAWLLAASLLPAPTPQAQSRRDADVLWAAGERVAAVDTLAQALAAAPDDVALRAELVRREIAIHRYQAALDHAEGLGAEVDPERGYCLFRLGRYEEALSRLDARRPDQTLYVCDVLEMLGRPPGARRAALEQAARTLGEDDPGVLARRGRLAAGEGRLEDAEGLFRAATERDPISGAAWFGLGQTLARLGRRDEATAALEHHRALLPLLDALEFAQKSLDLAPGHAPNHAYLGDAERDLGRLDRAEASYRRALALAADGDVTPIVLRHARLLEADRRDVDGAIAILDAAFARVPDVRLLVRRGDVELAAGRASAAEDSFVRAARYRPGDPEIEKRLAAARDAREGPGEERR